jgi:hypothetical protein
LGLVLAGLFVLVLPLRTAHAQCIGPLDDCDGDGMPNAVDPCPALAPAINAGEIKNGFQDVNCYLPLIDYFSTNPSPVKPFAATSKCVPVAAHRIDDVIPADALHPGTVGSKTTVKGVIIVGVVEQSGSLNPATAAQVKFGFKTGAVPADALFGCIASIQFADTGGLTLNQQVVYGYRVASSYTRAILEAFSVPLFSNTTSQDALGLIRSLTLGDASWRKGIHGTNGTWVPLMEWTTDPAVFAADSDTPVRVGYANDKSCVASIENTLQSTSGPLSETTPAAAPPWANLPDPAKTTFRSYASAFASTADYLASPDAKAFQWRATPFGPRPISTPLVGTPKTGPPAGTPKPAPKKPPAGPAGQFLEPGAVPKFDPGGVSVPPPEGCKSLGACGCQASALGFFPKGFDSKLLEPLFDASKPFTRWSDFFMQSAPYVYLRATDDLFSIVGGDQISAKKNVLNPLEGLPKWDLRTLAFVNVSPPQFVFSLPPNAAAPDPYKAGVVAFSPWDIFNDWTFFTGTSYEALYRLGVTERAITNVWEWNVASSGWHGVSASLSDGATGFQSYDAAAGTWTYLADGTIAQTDYVDASTPGNQWSKTSATGLYTNGVSVVASRHITADAFHPGGGPLVHELRQRCRAHGERKADGALGCQGVSNSAVRGQQRAVAVAAGGGRPRRGRPLRAARRPLRVRQLLSLRRRCSLAACRKLVRLCGFVRAHRPARGDRTAAERPLRDRPHLARYGRHAGWQAPP